MAARFWVGGTATWTAANTTNWSATSGGAGGASVPGAADTVTFDAASGGGVVTVGAAYNPSVISIDMGAFTGTLDFSANNNSPTMQTFNCSGTGTRTLNMGSGTWTLTGNATTIFNCSTVTNLTLNYNTSTVIANYSGATGTRTFNLGNATQGQLYNLNITAGTDSVNLTGSGSVNINGDLNFTGFSGTAAVGTTQLYGNLTLNSTMTWTTQSSAITFKATSGIKTITSNGVQVNQTITLDGVGGTWQLADALNMGGATARTITLTNGTFNANNFNVTCGSFSSSNSNVRTLTMGSGTWTLTGNNATIFNISTAVNLSMTATTATVNCTYSGSIGTRTLSSGNNNSSVVGPNFYITAGTDIVNLGNSSPRFQSMDFTGFSGTLTNGSATQINIASSLTFSSTMTNSYTAAIFFNGTDSATTGTLITNGITLNSAVSIAKTGFTLTLGSSLNNSSTITHSNGTFNANGYNVTAASFSSSNANVRTLTLGSGTWTLTGSGTPWDITTTTNLTMTASTGLIILNDASASTKTFSGGSLTYGSLRLTGAGTGAFIILGSNTFNVFTMDTPPHTLQFTAGTTTAFNTFNVNGANAGSLMTITSSTLAQHTLKNNGNLPVIVSFCNISYSNAT